MHSTGQQQQPQERARSCKRSSMFNLRSRSNTAGSITPSVPSLNGLDMNEDDAPPQSPTVRPSRNSSPGRLSGTSSRKSLFRGKMGKMLSETVTSSVDQRESETGESRSPISGRGDKEDLQSGRSGRTFRHRISSPFDFQHISHADRNQFAALEKISGQSLNAGLLAAHTARLPSRANFSSDNLRLDQPDEESATTLRFARSVDSFSQPSNGVYGHGRSQSAAAARRPYSPFPMLSLRNDLELSGEEQGSNALPSPRSKRESGIWSVYATGPSMTPELSPGLLESPSYFEHALTTPDDSAIYTSSPPFSPSLEDVAEEPERFVKPRPAPQPPSRITIAATSSALDSFSFRSQRSPKPRSLSRGSIHTSPKSPSPRHPIAQPMSPTSPVSEAPGPATLARRMSIQKPTTNRRQSNTWRGIEASWEDDVDFIYDNELEADCDSEWDQALYSQNQTNQISDSQKLAVTAPYSVTMSLSQEGKDTCEATYEELLEEFGDSDQHFPISDARQSGTSSTRSSNMRSSGRSSYDSSLMSSAQSSGLWNSSIQRSTSPAGSLPDLIPSQRMRKELSFDAAKEDHDITLTG